jgi:hypothetical protein
MHRRRLVRTIACVVLIMMLMGMVGCEATGLGMSFAESLVAAAIVGSPALVAVSETVRRWFLPQLTPNSTEAEAWAVLKAHWERDSDVERWLNEGGRVSPWD